MTDHATDEYQAKGEKQFFILALILAVLWIGSIAIFGFAGFFMPAVIASFICLFMLVIMSRG